MVLQNSLPKKYVSYRARLALFLSTYILCKYSSSKNVWIFSWASFGHLFVLLKCLDNWQVKNSIVSKSSKPKSKQTKTSLLSFLWKMIFFSIRLFVDCVHDLRDVHYLLTTALQIQKRKNLPIVVALKTNELKNEVAQVY